MENKYISFGNGLKKIIDVSEIKTTYFREFTSDYIYDGEKHDFWEMLFIESGEINIVADSNAYRLKKGDIIFHRPNEFHTIQATGNSSCNAIIISFVSYSIAMKNFENKVVNISDDNAYLFTDFIKEAQSFHPGLGDFFRLGNDYGEAVFGSNQLMYAALERILITINRDLLQDVRNIRSSAIARNKIDNSLLQTIIEYLEENLDKKLRIKDILQKFFISETQLKTLFKKHLGTGIINYFNMLKMEKAKLYIREQKYSYTEISNMLGFDTIHYFSTSFKKYTKMSPSEYIRSVKSILDDTN